MLPARLELLTHLRHHLERIGDVDHIGLAPRPSAIRVERNRPPLADEAPAHYMRPLSVTTSRQALRVARCRASLTDLIHMREKRQDDVPFAALVDERFRAAQRRTRCAKKIKISSPASLAMNLPVRLLLCPACPRDKQQLRFRSNRLLILLGARNPVTFVRSAGNSTGTDSTCTLPSAPAKAACVPASRSRNQGLAARDTASIRCR